MSEKNNSISKFFACQIQLHFPAQLRDHAAVGEEVAGGGEEVGVIGQSRGGRRISQKKKKKPARFGRRFDAFLNYKDSSVAAAEVLQVSFCFPSTLSPCHCALGRRLA